MAQIINDLDLGSMLGRQLGTGISKGLSQLAQFKMQDIMKRQNRDAYEQMKPGMGWLAELHPSIQKTYMENMFQMHPEMFDNPETPQQETIQDFTPYQNAVHNESPLQEIYPQPGQMNADAFVGNMLQGQIGMGMPKMGPGAQMLKQSQAPQPQVAPQPMKSVAQKPKTDIQMTKTPQELGYNINVPRQRELYNKHVAAEQRRIDAKFKRLNDEIDKKEAEAYETIDLANEALNLINTGQTRSGIMGLLPPEWSFAGKETRELERIYTKLAAMEAGKKSGVLSQAKIKFAEAQKPKLNMPIDAQREILNDMIEDAYRNGVRLKEVASTIRDENKGETPLNFGDVLTKRFREYKAPTSKKQQYPVGTKRTDTTTGKVEIMGPNGWRPA